MSADRPSTNDSPADGSPSRPSKNNRQGAAEGISADELGGPSRRPVAVRENAHLRDEARAARFGPGDTAPLSEVPLEELSEQPEIQARLTHQVLSEWREWMRDYDNSHIEYLSPENEVVRAPLENSYQESYSRRYYARLKDFERGVNRQYDNLTTVMLTFSASHENANGEWRCPADHLRDVMDGWDTARKQLYQVLDGYEWEYIRILEPHADGYGHLHVGVAIDTEEIAAEAFRPVVRSHVGACDSAGSEAHELHKDGLGDTVSVNGDIDNLGSYLSEYLGIYGEEETALDRPLTEQMFYAITWATNSRRLDFSNGGQEIIAGEEFRRETGLRPEDRGAAESDGAEAASDGSDGDGEESEGWQVDQLCHVDRGEPEYFDATAGGRLTGPIDGRSGVDPPKRVD